MFDLPPPGFRALDPNRQVHVYRRHLPHWRQTGATYFVTFHLADSLPTTCLEQFDELRSKAARRATGDGDQADHDDELVAQVEKWLDKGHGTCCLAEPPMADIVQKAILHFQGVRYQVFGAIVMPNHVHAVVRPFEGHRLEDIVGSWKKFTARRINAATNGKGALWHEEYFDRIVRDTNHLRRVMEYMDKNAAQIHCRRKMWVDSSCREWWRERDA